MPDPDILALAANMQRVLVSHDLKTMPVHFYRYLEQSESPGLILIPQLWPISQAVEGLRIAWTCLDAKDFGNQILYLPR